MVVDRLAEYWRRVKLQDEGVLVTYDVLASPSAAGGIAHWHVAYQVQA